MRVSSTRFIYIEVPRHPNLHAGVNFYEEPLLAIHLGTAAAAAAVAGAGGVATTGAGAAVEEEAEAAAAAG